MYQEKRVESAFFRVCLASGVCLEASGAINTFRGQKVGPPCIMVANKVNK